MHDLVDYHQVVEEPEENRCSIMFQFICNYLQHDRTSVRLLSVDKTVLWFGRVMFEKIQPGVEKMIPIALHGDNVAPIYLVRTPVMEALHRTPGPGEYESIRTSWY
jgi:hypothetical protein